MFEKIEFSDLYKFIASIGIVLIAIAFAYPIFLSQTDYLRVINETDVTSFNLDFHQIIHQQNILILFLLKYWFVVTGVILAIGMFLFTIGVYHWNKRQSVLDRLQNIDLAIKEDSFKRANKEEIKNKNNEDADEVISDESERENFINKYIEVEELVYKEFTKQEIIAKYGIKASRNIKIGNFVYDLLIVQRARTNLRKHIICEIKYFEKSASEQALKSGATNFLLSIQNYLDIVEKRRNIQIVPIPTLVWIYDFEGMGDFLQERSSELTKFARNKGLKLRIIICHKKNIEILPQRIMEYMVFKK